MLLEVSANTAYDACRKWLPDYPAIIEQPVSWGEMDALGHVNNIVYFRYFESARMEYFSQIGYDNQQHDDEEQLGPILAETYCKFRAALEYPDFIAVGARVTEVLEDRFTMRYAVASYQLNRVAAEGTGLVVSYDYKARQKTALPAKILDGIRRLESRHLEKN